MRSAMRLLVLIVSVLLSNCAPQQEAFSDLNDSACGVHNGVTTLCSDASDTFVRYRWDAEVWKTSNQFGEVASIDSGVCGGIGRSNNFDYVGEFDAPDDELECRPMPKYTGWKQMGGEFPGKCMVYGPYLSFGAPPSGKVHGFNAFLKFDYAKWSSDAYIDIEITADLGAKKISKTERWKGVSWRNGGVKSHFGHAEGALTNVEVRICNNQFAHLTLADITLKHEYMNKGDVQ